MSEGVFTDAPGKGSGGAADPFGFGGADVDTEYPGGRDTEFEGRILPSGRDNTTGEDYASQPSGDLVGGTAPHVGEPNGVAE